MRTTTTAWAGGEKVAQSLGHVRPDPEHADGEARTVAWIEEMSEEEVSLLAEDLMSVLMRWAAGHQPEVPSEAP